MRVASSSSGTPVNRHGAKRRAEAGRHDRRSQSLAGHVGHGHQQASIRLRQNVEIVARPLRSRSRSEAQRVARNLRQLLRQQRTLNVAGRIQILLHPRKLHDCACGCGRFREPPRPAAPVLRESRLRRWSARGRPGGATTSSVMRLPSRSCRGKSEHGGALAVSSASLPDAAPDHSAPYDRPVPGKRRAGHLQFAHHDAQHRLQHLLFADGRVHLPRGLEQRLQAQYLLLKSMVSLLPGS